MGVMQLFKEFFRKMIRIAPVSALKMKMWTNSVLIWEAATGRRLLNWFKLIIAANYSLLMRIFLGNATAQSSGVAHEPRQYRQ